MRTVYSISCAQSTRARHRAEDVTAKILKVLFTSSVVRPLFKLRNAHLMHLLIGSLIASPRLRVDIHAINRAALVKKLLALR